LLDVWTFHSLQLSVLRLGLLQDGDVGVGVFPGRKEISTGLHLGKSEKVGPVGRAISPYGFPGLKIVADVPLNFVR
jgi:hypothetical protein